MRFAVVFAALMMFFLPAAASAQPACYTPAQLHAEELLRLHSELMVITVTCRQASDGMPLPAAYSDFTQKNIATLHGAEQEMLAYYKTHARGDATTHLDRLRTILANEYGQKAASMSAPIFCGAYRDRVVQYDRETPGQLEGEAERMMATEHSIEPVCASSGTVLAGRK